MFERPRRGHGRAGSRGRTTRSCLRTTAPSVLGTVEEAVMVAPVGSRVLTDPLNFAEPIGAGRRLESPGDDFAYEVRNAPPFLLCTCAKCLVLPRFKQELGSVHPDILHTTSYIYKEHYSNAYRELQRD